MITYAREQAEKAGRTYHGTYPNLHSPGLEITIEERKLSLLFAESIINPRYNKLVSRLVFFADGSLDARHLTHTGGAGVTFRRFPTKSDRWTDKYVAIHGITDSRDAELVATDLAIQQALSEIHQAQEVEVAGLVKRDRPLHIYIFTDSCEVLTSLRKFIAWLSDNQKKKLPIFEDPSFVSMVFNLNRLLRHNVHLKLRWVKGHSTSTGNQRADILANKGLVWMRSNPLPSDSTVPYAVFNIPTTSPTLHDDKVAKKRKAMEISTEREHTQGETSAPNGPSPRLAKRALSYIAKLALDFLHSRERAQQNGEAAADSPSNEADGMGDEDPCNQLSTTGGQEHESLCENKTLR